MDLSTDLRWEENWPFLCLSVQIRVQKSIEWRHHATSE